MTTSPICTGVHVSPLTETGARKRCGARTFGVTQSGTNKIGSRRPMTAGASQNHTGMNSPSKVAFLLASIQELKQHAGRSVFPACP